MTVEWEVPAGFEPATSRCGNPRSFGPDDGQVNGEDLLVLYPLSYGPSELLYGYQGDGTRTRSPGITAPGAELLTLPPMLSVLVKYARRESNARPSPSDGDAPSPELRACR